MRPSVSGLRQRPGDAHHDTSLSAHHRSQPAVDPPRPEWDQLSRRPAVVARARSWGVTTTPFHSLDELLRLAGFKVGPSADADEVLRRLVDRRRRRSARRPHRPAAVCCPVCWPSSAGNSNAIAASTPSTCSIGEAWLAIVSYRADRRPTRRRRQTAQRRPPPGVHHAATPTGPDARGRRRHRPGSTCHGSRSPARRSRS